MIPNDQLKNHLSTVDRQLLYMIYEKMEELCTLMRNHENKPETVEIKETTPIKSIQKTQQKRKYTRKAANQ